MSRHAVYLSTIVVLLMTAARTPAQDHVWPALNLDDDGTSPNQGRMIEWGPAPPWQAGLWVHATWVDNDVAWYDRSTNEGQSWTDFEQVPSSHPYSYGPALRALPNGIVWVCKEATDGVLGYWWESAIKMPAPNSWMLGEVPADPPSPFVKCKSPVATVVSTTSSQPMAYMVTCVWNSIAGGYFLYFVAFDHVTTGVTVRYAAVVGVGSPIELQPSIDYLPGDRAIIVYRDPYGGIRERSWARDLTPDDIRSDSVPTWAGPYEVSWDSPPGMEPGSHPCIDMDGQFGYCTWRGFDPNSPDLGEMWWAKRYDDRPQHPWSDRTNKSQTPGYESDYSQCCTQTTDVWQEQVPEPANNTEIYTEIWGVRQCISSAPGFMNWWPQASVRNPVPPDFPPVFRCHTLWSQEAISGGAQSVHYKRHEFIPPVCAGFEYPTYLKPILGQAKASPYCVERDGYREYRDIRVDFGKSGLVYDLPYLDPAHDYLAQFTLFNGELLPITQSIKLGGVAVAQKTLSPGGCETLYVYIPRAAYKTAHARLDVGLLAGPFACLANDIRIYETYRSCGPDGALAQTVPGTQQVLRARPNPFSPRSAITLEVASPGAVIRVYDASGRLVRSLHAEGSAGLGCVAVWDGTDGYGKALPVGVYTCTCATGSIASSVKVVRR